MSLINEALKRAEQDKQAKSIDRMGYKPVDAPSTAASGPAGQGKAMLITFGVALLCVSVWLISKGLTQAPSAAVADSRRGAATPSRSVASSSTPRKAAKPEHPAAPAAEISEPDLVIAKTMATSKYYHPAAQPRDQYDDFWDARPGAEAILAASALPTPEQPPVTKAPAAIPPVSVTATEYKLRAVVRGSEGGAAIINGRFVKLGETIDGATLVEIGRSSVTLDVGGHMVTIHM